MIKTIGPFAYFVIHKLIIIKKNINEVIGVGTYKNMISTI